jgi:hypothetical protein
VKYEQAENENQCQIIHHGGKFLHPLGDS